MVTTYGVDKLTARRIFELVKQYRRTIQELERRKYKDWAVPDEWSEAEKTTFINKMIGGLQTRIDRIKLKIEIICEEALERIGLTISLTVSQSSYGKVDIRGDCPVCSVNVSLIDSLVDETSTGGRRGLRCTACDAVRWI